MNIDDNFWNSAESIPEIGVGGQGQFWVALDNGSDVSVELLTYLNLPILADDEGNLIDGCEDWVLFLMGKEVGMVGWSFHDVSTRIPRFKLIDDGEYKVLGWSSCSKPIFEV